MRAASAQIGIEEYGDGDGGLGSYEGQMNQRGWPHGKGVQSWPDGDRYVGELREGRWHGHGTCTYADGRVESGKWENHNFRG